jgi:hypothetical protein
MPGPADAIFVFAGRESRKRTGLKLFRAGEAPRLIISVARFEWRRFALLGLEDDGGLVDLVPTIEAPKRHFFVQLGPEGASCEPVTLGRFGTWTEARAISRLIAKRGYRRVLVVSHREHLPRCLVALRAFLPPGVEAVPVASEDPEPLSRFDEAVKLAGYRLLAAVERRKPHRRACAGPGFLL